MGRLRDKMAEDLRLRGFAPQTQRTYLRYAQRFADHYHRSPAMLGEREVRAFLLHMVKVEGVAPSTHVICVASLKFLYAVTLQGPQVMERIPYPRRPLTLPGILSGSEVRGCWTASPPSDIARSASSCTPLDSVLERRATSFPPTLTPSEVS